MGNRLNLRLPELLTKNQQLEVFKKFMPPQPALQKAGGIGSLLGEFYYKQIFICQKCNSNFRTVHQFQQHNERKHNSSSKYVVSVINGNYIKKRLDNCHTETISNYQCVECGEKLEIQNSCFLRICEKCQSVRTNRIRKKMKVRIQNFKRKIFLTLTYAGHHAINKKIIDNLNYSWKLFFKMLNYQYPYKYQYCKILETKSYADGIYYHLHLVVDMPYIPQEKLCSMWKKATKGFSFVVDIRQIGRNQPIKNAVNYISKYLAKPIKLEQTTENNVDINELYARFLYGRHFSHNHTLLDSSAILEQKSPLKCRDCSSVMVQTYCSYPKSFDSVEESVPPPNLVSL